MQVKIIAVASHARSRVRPSALVACVAGGFIRLWPDVTDLRWQAASIVFDLALADFLAQQLEHGHHRHRWVGQWVAFEGSGHAGEKLIEAARLYPPRRP